MRRWRNSPSRVADRAHAGADAMDYAADRGGPFVRNEGPARHWMRAAAPGIAFRFPPDESSPIGGRAPASAERSRNSIRVQPRVTIICIILLVAAGIVSFGA